MRHIQYSKNDTYAKHNFVKDGYVFRNQSGMNHIEAYSRARTYNNIPLSVFFGDVSPEKIPASSNIDVQLLTKRVFVFH